MDIKKPPGNRGFFYELCKKFFYQGEYLFPS